MAGPDQIVVFDRVSLRKHLHRAANNFAAHRVLFDEVALQLAERLRDVKRDFTVVLELGSRGESLKQCVKPESLFVTTNFSESFANTSSSTGIVADEEYIPFAAESFDLVLSNMALHWVNDLPGALSQIKHVLKKDGLFIASMLGGQTLIELRMCLMEAELSITGGASPRLSPTVDLQTASGLLQRAGFTLSVADQEVFTLTYPDMFALMRDLRGMGEANAHSHRLKHATRRAVFDEAARLYKERFADPMGRIFATFEVVFLHGWVP